MGLIAWGLVLLLIGVILTFTNLLGFIPGVPLATIGIILIALGILLAVLSIPFRVARRV